MYRALPIHIALIAILLYSILMIVLPQHARAFGTVSDAFCGAQYCFPGKCTPKDPGCIPCASVTCIDPGSNVKGQCVTSVPGKCQAMNAPGLGGGNALDQGLGQLGQMLGQFMQKLMQGQQGGGGSGSGGSAGGTSPGCRQQQTSDLTVYQSNPSCYYYVQPVSSQLSPSGSTALNTSTNVSDTLLGALGNNPSSSSNSSTNVNTNTNTNTNVSDQLGAFTSTSTLNATVNASTTTASSTGLITSVPANAADLLPGIRGDIRVLGNGATVLGGQRDQNSNTEVAGFFGANSFNGQGTGIVASLCASRPWASGLFSKVIPPSFFDGLCALRGYQVGAPVPVKTTPAVVVSQSKPAPVATSTPKKVATSTVPSVPPKVDIWAVPAKVSLGSRTSVFWNTQGVTQCAETSPDGSFSQASLSGGASTVPITTATTFTISCLAPDGSPVTDYVTVNLSI